MTLDKVHGLEDVEAEKGVDESTLYDPHTWNDPVKVSEEAQLIATQLAKKDPKNAKVYQKMLINLVTRQWLLQRSISQNLKLQSLNTL